MLLIKGGALGFTLFSLLCNALENTATAPPVLLNYSISRNVYDSTNCFSSHDLLNCLLMYSDCVNGQIRDATATLLTVLRGGEGVQACTREKERERVTSI